MSAGRTPDPQAAVTVGDMQAIIGSIVGAGIGLANLLPMLIDPIPFSAPAADTYQRWLDPDRDRRCLSR